MGLAEDSDIDDELKVSIAPSYLGDDGRNRVWIKKWKIKDSFEKSRRHNKLRWGKTNLGVQYMEIHSSILI